MELTEHRIRNFCGKHTKPIISSDMMRIEGVNNLLNNGFSIEHILFEQVKQWGLRPIFDAYCDEYNWHDSSAHKTGNIYLKIQTLQLVCQNLGCDFSDIIKAFVKENFQYRHQYRTDGATGFFNQTFDSVADGSILKENSINNQFVSQIINFAKYRGWERWASSMKPRNYDIIEFYFSKIHFLYFIRNRPLPSIDE